MTRKVLPTILAALALLLPCAAWAKPPVWTVQGKGATITLFGSVHILPQGKDWRPEALTEALAEADELWFETPIDEAAMLDISRQALAQGMLPAGRDLASMMSEH